MALKLDVTRLQELMSDFYTVAGIKIVIFDDEYNEILSFPARHCAFCDIMQTGAATRPQCLKSNADSFAACRQSGKLVVYHCHAGLIEATAPLKEKGIIIGYIMFGQVTDIKDKKHLAADILNHSAGAAADLAQWQPAIRKIKYKSIPEIKSAAKIMEACTYYILLNELVAVKHERLVHKMNNYINDHLQDEITMNVLCGKLHVSRTKLYEITRQYLGMGIAGYIKGQRMAKAKALLTHTEARIAEISELTGFATYSYFCKVFKQESGLSPTEYRARQRLDAE